MNSCKNPSIPSDFANEPWVGEFIQMLDCTDPSDLKIDEAYQLKMKHVPKTLYKYRRFDEKEHALSSLEKNFVWLSSPADYNDPFECQEYFDSTQMEHALFRLHFDKMTEEANPQFEIPVEARNNIKMAKEPFDELIKYVLEKEGMTEKDQAFLAAGMKDVFREVGEKILRYFVGKRNEGIRICSFSKRKDSILMWSHYTQDHKGFCIEYDIDKLPRFDSIIRRLYPIIYCTCLYDSTRHKLKYIENGGTYNNIYSVMTSMRKAFEWNYEQEWRLVFNHEILDKNGNYLFAPISGVYLGCKITQENKDKVLAICVRKKIPVFQAETSLDKYELVFKKLEG